MLRHLPAVGDRVAADDPRRAGDVRALHRRQADAAEPEHEHGRTRLDLGRVQHGTRAGLHRAPDHARDVERRVGRDLDRARLADERVLGEAADAHAAVDDLAVAGEAGGAVEERGRERLALVDALRRLRTRAPVATTARGDRREHDLVADRQQLDAVADRVDDARRLVPEHLRAVAEPTGEDRVVGVADAAVVHAHPHLTGRGIGDVDLVDLERARAVEQCGAQRAPLVGCWKAGS